MISVVSSRTFGDWTFRDSDYFIPLRLTLFITIL